MVSLHDGSAIDGLLITKRGPLLVVAEATLLTPDGEPARMDGHVYLERQAVRFIQAS